ncbi:hypothetical protein L596_018179 [Steinernema carpocapsae]|uniref:Uncharacterized protein n=1 Tax=Steinernema carpocapsae TaxID=34508 RepID=A0A4U5N3X4_STECR|nr:hypothetical protein L596_018179 [Steinernema carpocapsae]
MTYANLPHKLPDITSPKPSQFRCPKLPHLRAFQPLCLTKGTCFYILKPPNFLSNNPTFTCLPAPIFYALH